MISLSREAENMLREMSKAPPLYNRVGALSIAAEDAVRQMYASWKIAKKRTAKKRDKVSPAPPEAASA